MNAIVSVCANWGIGKDNKLLIHNKEDMQHFVKMTTGGCVIMGRSTFESFPKGPLKGRKNIVISQNPAYEREGFPREGTAEICGYDVCTSTHDALQKAQEYGLTTWLIGGASLYAALIDSCELAYVTKHACAPEADTFFPNLDKREGWTHIEQGPVKYTPQGIAFTFDVYKNNNVKG